MGSDYKFKYVDEFIENFLNGNLILQFANVELKGEKKPVEYREKFEKWLEFRNKVRDEDPGEFAKLTNELFSHLLTMRLGGVIIDHKDEYKNTADNDID